MAPYYNKGMKNVGKNLPEDFTNRLKQLFSVKDIQLILDGLSVTRPTTLRVNTLKMSIKELENSFHKNSIEFNHIPWYPDAFIINNVRVKQLSELPEYKSGCFYIQSLSSMIPALVLDPQSNEMILDIAAAPGSKTTQLATMMGNTGKIIANDTSQIRIYKLIANLNIQGIHNTTTIKSAGETLWKSYPEYFDKTLVDVPCSMEGRINVHDPKSYTDWSLKKIKVLAEVQKWMLRSAISATKPGGTIVYSTCTLSPEENEGVIDWILKKEKDALVVEPISISSLEFDEPILSWNNKTYNSQIAHTIRILPNRLMEGFYIAKLRKIKSTIPEIMKK